MARRIRTCAAPAEKLFVLMMLGDDREVAATYVMGRAKHLSPSVSQKI